MISQLITRKLKTLNLDLSWTKVLQVVVPFFLFCVTTIVSLASIDEI